MQDNKDNTQKNKPVPENERPEWAKSMLEEEWKSYVHSPQCRVCNAEHEGRKLRSEIEALVIERKTHVEVCNMIFERYGLRLAPHNIGRHMLRHAPCYASVLEGLLYNELGDTMNGAVGPTVDHAEFLFGVIQVGWQQLLQHPERVSVRDGIRAAVQLAQITKNMNIGSSGVSQEEITVVLDIMQEVMTHEQRTEVERRFLVFKDTNRESESLPRVQGQVPEGADETRGVMVAGEYIDLDGPTMLPADDPEDEKQQ